MLSADLTSLAPSEQWPRLEGSRNQAEKFLVAPDDRSRVQSGQAQSCFPFPPCHRDSPRPPSSRERPRPAYGWRRQGWRHAQSSVLCAGVCRPSIATVCLAMPCLWSGGWRKRASALVSRDPDALLSPPLVYLLAGPGSSSCCSCWQTTSRALAWSQVSTGHSVIITVSQISCMAWSP